MIKNKKISRIVGVCVCVIILLNFYLYNILLDVNPNLNITVIENASNDINGGKEILNNLKNSYKQKIVKITNFINYLKIFLIQSYYFFIVKCINYINYASLKILHYQLIQDHFNRTYCLYNIYSQNPSTGNIIVYNNMYVNVNGNKYLRLSKLYNLNPINNLGYNVYSQSDFNRVNRVLYNTQDFWSKEKSTTIKLLVIVSIFFGGFIKLAKTDAILNLINT